jgi:hypothetical protein
MGDVPDHGDDIGLDISLRNTHLRIEESYTDIGTVLTLREVARAAGFLDDVAHLRAIDGYGATIFNWLQVDGLMADLRRTSANAPEVNASELLRELESMASQVVEFHWYLWFVGR